MPAVDPAELMECAAPAPSPGDIPPADDDDVRPAPPSIGADVPVTYFGPPPSSSNPRLIGPLQLLTAGRLDENAGTIRLPLYEGRVGDLAGPSIWYVLTDTTDADNAAALGLNAAPKLAFADTGVAVREATYETTAEGDVILVFDAGTVDFSPEHSITPGAAPNEFPPDSVQPGSVGDAAYSPLVRIMNAGGHIYNAPAIAFGASGVELDAYCDGNVDAAGRMILHDKVVDICSRGALHENAGTVNLRLTAGFSFGRPVLYLSLEANADVPAALEEATFAPTLSDVTVGGDDSAFSAVERIFVTTNGPTNLATGINPQRQGLLSALRGEGGPLNVLGGIPTVATDYSPLWDVNFGEWTQAAIDRGYRARVTEEFQILGLVMRGFITGPDGSDYGSSGVIVNCPIVHRFL